MKLIIEIVLVILCGLLVRTVTKLLINLRINKIQKTGIKKAKVTSLRMIIKINNIVIFLIVVIVVLFMIPGLKVLSWSFLSGAGIVTLIIGCAGQDTLSNFFSGLGITFTDPFEIGDYIKCVETDTSGYIEDITLRHTVIRRIDNVRIIVPNSKMNLFTVENYNHTDNEVCKFAEYSVSYSSDIDLAMNILKEEISKMYNPNTNGVLNNIEFPKVRIVKWDTSSIIIRGWVWGKDNSMAFEEIFDLNYIIKKRFDEEGIEIPYQYVNVIDKSQASKKSIKKVASQKKKSKK